MISLTKLVAFMVLATASAHELRGSNHQFDGISVSESSECTPETVITLICNNAGGAKSDTVDMSCDEGKTAAPGMLNDFCGNPGGSWRISCNTCDTPPGGSNSISCKWNVPGTTPIHCPANFDAKYSENYTCENGVFICCTMSSQFDSVRMDNLDSTCHRDTGEDELEQEMTL